MTQMPPSKSTKSSHSSQPAQRAKRKHLRGESENRERGNASTPSKAQLERTKYVGLKTVDKNAKTYATRNRLRKEALAPIKGMDDLDARMVQTPGSNASKEALQRRVKELYAGTKQIARKEHEPVGGFIPDAEPEEETENGN